MYSISLFILCMSAAVGFAQECTEAGRIQPQKCEFGRNILLINNTSTYKDNEYFMTFSYDVKVINEICPGGVEGLITATELFSNCYIINLNVSDFFNFNYDYVSRYLIYAGDRYHNPHQVQACAVNKLDNQSIICNNNTIQNFSYPAVKLMSINVENYPALYNAVNDFIDPSYDLKRQTIRNHFILICGDKFDGEFAYYHGIVIKYSFNCVKDAEINQNYLLAVVAPKPLEMDYDIQVPIILYEAPCDDENIANIYNYIVMTSCVYYKYAIVEFLKSVGWTRVAVVSDNTPYSEKFERDMKALFEENQFAYTVVKCHETVFGKCNFVQALETLKKSDGRVFIANVGESNVRILLDQVRKVWTQKKTLLSWIFRGGHERRNIQPAGDIYSLSLDPKITQEIGVTLKHSVPNGIKHRDSIMVAIKKITHAYKHIKKENDEEERKPFLRKLTNKIRKHLSHDVKVNVYLETSIYTTMTIHNDSVKTLNEIHRQQDDLTSCIIRRKDYHYPCDDYNLLNILIVLVVVATCGLVAAIFYNRFYMNTRQYTNLQ